MSSAEVSGLREIGVGTNVMESDEVVEGRILFLDSPQEVLRFVTGDEVGSTIVISRGGTTTFMAPALAAGVRGLITLQGAPESHLGILSREFGIPCVMSVAFSEGVQTSRGRRFRRMGPWCVWMCPRRLRAGCCWWTGRRRHECFRRRERR